MSVVRTGWGIIGTGDVSRSIATDLALLDGARRRGVASRSAEKAAAFAAEFGIERWYSSVEELLADPAIDVVYIATPHATHSEIALQVLRAGKHVLIEKPVGIDRSEARRIADESARLGLFAMEAMWMTFNPAHRRLKQELAEGAIGEVRSLRASFGIAFPPGVGSRWSAELHGSTLLDQGIYPITLALDLFGPPTRIDARGTLSGDGIDLSEHITLEFEGGRYAQLAASMVDWTDPTASINGTTGWAHLPFPFWATNAYTIHPGRAVFEPRTETVPRQGYGYVPMLSAVQDALRDGAIEHPLHPWSEVFEVFAVMDEVRARLDEQATGETA